MASDLVERLRADRDWHRNPTRWSHEAADEIERLRASTNDAPVERLVEAVFPVLRTAYSCGYTDRPGDRNWSDNAARLTGDLRAALSSPSGEPVVGERPLPESEAMNEILERQLKDKSRRLIPATREMAIWDTAEAMGPVPKTIEAFGDRLIAATRIVDSKPNPPPATGLVDALRRMADTGEHGEKALDGKSCRRLAREALAALTTAPTAPAVGERIKAERDDLLATLIYVSTALPVLRTMLRSIDATIGEAQADKMIRIVQESLDRTDHPKPTPTDTADTPPASGLVAAAQELYRVGSKNQFNDPEMRKALRAFSAALTTAPTAPVDREAARSAFYNESIAATELHPGTQVVAIDSFLRAIASLLPKIPEGWVVVPREPTEAMLRKGHQASDDFMSFPGMWSRTNAVWSAMLSAATPPSVGEGGGA